MIAISAQNGVYENEDLPVEKSLDLDLNVHISYGNRPMRNSRGMAVSSREESWMPKSLPTNSSDFSVQNEKEQSDSNTGRKLAQDINI